MKTCKFEDLKKLFLMAQMNIHLHHIIPANSLKKWWIKMKKYIKRYKIVLCYFLCKGFQDFFIGDIDLWTQKAKVRQLLAKIHVYPQTQWGMCF